ncbi:MerR family transcriptional regulator [Schlesneria paludicola]|uniref:MerR family transcriptional regulator n=1 Tax=Schlesneria paludicola TaxID=360056 RepID=UPI00029A336B|nr:MerR family DNA-binding protein [Schlesneria paludicola]
MTRGDNLMMTLSIGELAKRGGVGVETVRFYERQGLLEEPERKSSGYRQYDAQTVQVLRFIRRAKELGFTLKEIKSLLEIRTDVSTPRTEVRQQARKKVAEIDEKIADLQRMREGLQSLINQCHGDGSIVGCPILNALQGSDSTQT